MNNKDAVEDRQGWTFSGDIVRFILAGGLNAALTMLVYQALLFIMPHQLAYTIAWILGIIFVMVVYPSRVFPEGKKGLADRFALGASYAAVFFLGLLLLEFLTSVRIHPRVSIFLVMGFTTVVGFIAGRALLR